MEYVQCLTAEEAVSGFDQRPPSHWSFGYPGSHLSYRWVFPNSSLFFGCHLFLRRVMMCGSKSSFCCLLSSSADLLAPTSSEGPTVWKKIISLLPHWKKNEKSVSGVGGTKLFENRSGIWRSIRICLNKDMKYVVRSVFVDLQMYHGFAGDCFLGRGQRTGCPDMTGWSWCVHKCRRCFQMTTRCDFWDCRLFYKIPYFY